MFHLKKNAKEIVEKETLFELGFVSCVKLDCISNFQA